MFEFQSGKYKQLMEEAYSQFLKVIEDIKKFSYLGSMTFLLLFSVFYCLV